MDVYPVEVEAHQKGLELLVCGWLQKNGDGLDPRQQRAYAWGGEAVTQKFDVCAAKDALLRIDHVAVLL
jgi:hypothetical protein